MSHFLHLGESTLSLTIYVLLLYQPHVKRYYILVGINEGETTASGDYNSGDAEALNGLDDFATTNDNPNLQDDTYSTARFAALLNE